MIAEQKQPYIMHVKYLTFAWAMLWHYSCLLMAAACLSSIFCGCWTLCSLSHGQPGPLLKSRTSQYITYSGMHWWSIRIRWPSSVVFFHWMYSLCFVVSFSPWLPDLLLYLSRTHLICFFAISCVSFSSIAVSGQSSAL